MSGRGDGSGRDEGDVALAAEYVLNLLSPREREEAARRAGTEDRFRRLVAEWSEDFAGLAEEVDPVAPPRSVRRALKRAVAQEARAPRRSRRGASAALGWVLGALAAGAAAILILSVALPVVEPPYSGPLYRAELTQDGSDLRVLARFDPRDDVLSLDRGGVAAAPGRALELWLLPEGADAPLSLGVLPEDETVRLSLPPEVARGIPGGLLEISEEPPGGSPTGGPTGPVLAVGSVEEA